MYFFNDWSSEFAKFKEAEKEDERFSESLAD